MERGISLEFDKPYIVCPSCKSVVDRKSGYDEWFLMGFFKKSFFLIWNLIVCVLGAAIITFIPFLLLILADAFLDTNLLERIFLKDYRWITFAIVIFIYMVILIRLLYVMVKEIIQSCKRKYNIEYLNILFQYGFIKSENQYNRLIKSVNNQKNMY